MVSATSVQCATYKKAPENSSCKTCLSYQFTDTGTVDKILTVFNRILMGPIYIYMQALRYLVNLQDFSKQ